jgi:hypothetical protein
MRFTLFILASALLSVVVVPSVRAQHMMPYRRTIPYISNRPYQPSGRYVRISVSMGSPQISSIGTGALRSSNSFTIQALINTPVSNRLSDSDSSTSTAGDDRRRPGDGR